MANESGETSMLIGSDKVEGTDVYGSDGSKIGSIERLMIGKRDGKVAYATLAFGGFLGIENDYYPIPWSMLKYDTELGGYKTNLTEAQLDGAPRYSRDSDWGWDEANSRKVSDFYKQPFVQWD